MITRVALIAEDEQGLETLLRRVEGPDAFIVGAWRRSCWTLHQLQRLRPQTVLMPLVRVRAERSALRSLAMAASVAPTIVVTDSRQPQWLAQLLLWGAWGMVPEGADDAQLLEAVQAAAAGHPAWTEGAARRAARAIFRAHGEGQLTALRPAPSAEPGERAAAACPQAAQRVLLSHLEESPAGETTVELALTLGIPLSDVEARLDSIERQTNATGRGASPPPAMCATQHLSGGLRFLVNSLRSQRTDRAD
jgi:DNA-binding NarL/FixJ family response regulator